MQRIDDRDIIINQGGGRRLGFPYIGAAALAITALTCLAGLWLLIQTFDPQARAAREAAQWQQEQLDSQLEGVNLFGAALVRLALPVAFSLAVLGLVIVGLLLLYRRWAAVASIQAHYQVKAIEARYNVPVPTHYAPHFAGVSRDLPESVVIDAPALEAPALPGITDLATLNYRPTKDAILLGLGPNRQITVPMGKLWHVATAGPTGNGKSNIHRLLLAQLCALGAHVAIGDPKWTPYDQEQNEDWRPIEQRLHLAPAVSADQIGALLDYAAGEMAKRLERRRKQEPIGKPLFICLDELPWIYDHVKAADGQIAELVRLGRGVGVFTLAAAQDFLVKSTGLGAARDNFRSAFYLGGDLKTGSVLLDITQSALGQREHEITFGTALLRSSVTTPPALVRVPYVSNQALYGLLGLGAQLSASSSADPSANSGAIVEGEATVRTEVAPNIIPAVQPLSAELPKALDANAHRVRELLRQKAGVNEILREVWGIEKNERGAAYRQALVEYQEIVARLLG